MQVKRQMYQAGREVSQASAGGGSRSKSGEWWRTVVCLAVPSWYLGDIGARGDGEKVQVGGVCIFPAFKTWGRGVPLAQLGRQRVLKKTDSGKQGCTRGKNIIVAPERTQKRKTRGGGERFAKNFIVEKGGRVKHAGRKERMTYEGEMDDLHSRGRNSQNPPQQPEKEHQQ